MKAVVDTNVVAYFPFAPNRVPAKGECPMGGKVRVVPTNEEPEIARATAAALR